MSGTGCFPVGEMAAVARVCRDGAAAARLKTGSLLAILVASAVGICLPVALTGAFRGKAGYARGLLLVKCYAAGVILSTSLVHVLPDAHAALADCAVATRRPWRDFPFAGLFSLVGALLALLVDLSASSHLEAHGHHQHAEEGDPPVFELSGEMSPKKRAHSDDTDRDDVALFGAKSAARSDEAGFGIATVGYMCVMFSVTTPLGILLGMAIFHMTGYDDSSPNALIIEGLLGSLSAGILVYMALVDLISLDFFHNKMMSSSNKLKKVSYVALVLGSASMSILALWA
uniref:Uncharacterized protein n=1 Tax=Oryza barthii TaxID=65489 RepID=A0A0D3G3M4_9ORYZ